MLASSGFFRVILSSFRSSSGCPTHHRPILFALPVDHRTINNFEKYGFSSLVRSGAIAVLFPLPHNVSFIEHAYKSIAILASDSKLSFWAALTVRNNFRSQFGGQSAQLKESAIRRVVERHV